MSDHTYHNPALKDAENLMRGMNPNAIVGLIVCERIITAVVFTDPEGTIQCGLTIDMIDGLGRLIHSTPLAMYEFEQQRRCTGDAEVLSAQTRHRWRRCNPGKGFTYYNGVFETPFTAGPKIVAEC